MAHAERRLELEPAVEIGSRVLIPIAWTVGRPVIRGHTLNVAMCREAFGVIVRDEAGLSVFLSDGRRLSVEELVAEYPALAVAVASL